MILYPLTISPYDFYPRPPRGGRRTSLTKPGKTAGFLSTPSARRATHDPQAVALEYQCISIHALREEGDIIILI